MCSSDLQALEKSPVTVIADPNECSFQFNPTGTASFTSSCDIAKSFLARNSVNYSNQAAPAGTLASVKVGDKTIASFDKGKAGAFDPVKDPVGKGVQVQPIRLDIRPAVKDKVMVAVQPASTAHTHDDEADELEAPAADASAASGPGPRTGKIVMPPRDRTVIRLPAYEVLKDDPVLYAHANRVLHLETNPGNARALVQRHGEGPGAQRFQLVVLAGRNLQALASLQGLAQQHPGRLFPQGFTGVVERLMACATRCTASC